MRYFASAAVFLCLCGCTAQQGQNFNASGAEQIRVGVTTKSAVEQAMGPPLTRDIKGDTETWMYSYSATDTSGPVAGSMLAGVPLVGGIIMASTMQNAQMATESKQVSITFSRGVVQACNVILSSGSSTMTNMQGQRTTRQIPCGQSVN